MWTTYKKQRKNTKIQTKKRFTIYYQNELDNAYFQHDTAYGDFKDLTRRELLIKYCIIKHLILLKIKKYGGYQTGIASIVYKIFDKKTSGGAIKNEIISSKELAGQLHIPIIRKF